MKISHLSLLLSALLVSGTSAAAERIFLQLPVQLAPGVELPPRVQAECDLEHHFAQDAEAQISKRFRPVEIITSGTDVGNDKVIKLTLTNINALGGAAWTGPKSVSMQVELMRGGEVLDARVFSRSSQGTLLTGTCEMLHKVSKALGADVGVWLKRGANAQAEAAAPAAGAGE
ncbi:hypothetical protein [Pseudoduganella violaceinigra]|uniref:hypothetical protein n=1 Tax=Pseudoduganella violaceinigra TaxID=246602 RepID=UPI00041224A1|nr:hypothetical protein [Pseudoduganella violaceinigra]